MLAHLHVGCVFIIVCVLQHFFQKTLWFMRGNIFFYCKIIKKKRIGSIAIITAFDEYDPKLYYPWIKRKKIINSWFNRDQVKKNINQ